MIDNERVSLTFLKQMFETMVRIRLFEKKVNELFLKGLVPGTIHLYAGEEAVAVGVCSALERTDIIVGTHRPHGHALAKGVAPNKIMAEILGKAGGCCRGKGGSMHVGDISKGMLPALAIVGSGIPIAAGVALTFKLKKIKGVSVSFFGDGATNEGAFHEGLNLAAVWKLPAIFVCENNLFGVSTRISDTVLLENLSDRSSSYGMPGISVDGNNVEEVFYAAREAVHSAKKGNGPTLIECKTYRHWGHSRTDPAKYRGKEEVEAWLARDPLVVARGRLSEMGLSDDDFKHIEKDQKEVIESAAEFAVNCEPPSPEEALKMVWAV
jgi:TPP-dependent pyruvate/acetoin dehydrogenase alpha subunit